MVVTQVEITKRFIEKGLGISFLPITMVEEELNKGTMLEIPTHLIKRPTSFTYVVNKVKTSEVNEFIDKYVSIKKNGF
jgi:LysR family transcriptional repressor of citA